jgi:hypothetical protein
VGDHALLKSGHTSVVHHDVDRSDALGQSEPIGFLAYVKPFKLASNFCGRSRTRVGIDVGNKDESALPMKSISNSAADASSSARNDARLINQSLHVILDIQFGRRIAPMAILVPPLCDAK